MQKMPLWTAIIPTFGTKGVDLTRDALESLAHSTEAHEIIVVDDGSKPKDQEYLAELCEKEGALFVPLAENGGFAKAVNAGMIQANGHVLILWNNDALQIDKTCDDLANFIMFTNFATCGIKLLYGDGTVQHGGVHYIPAQPHGYWDHIGRFEPRWTNYVCRIREGLCTGAVLAINRYALDAVGLLDERYGMAVEDIDFQLRCLESGFKTYYCGIIEAYHLEGRTRGNTLEDKAAHPEWTEAERKGLQFFFEERWVGINWDQWRLGA